MSPRPGTVRGLLSHPCTVYHHRYVPLSPRASYGRGRKQAFTLLEVLLSAFLISAAMGSILAMNARAAHALRAARSAAASSQILQQRLELVRDRPWMEVASSRALAAQLRTPASSEVELYDAHLTETMRVTVPVSSPGGLVETARSFVLRRVEGVVSVEQAGDFSKEPTLLFEGSVTWRDESGVNQRALRSVVCRHGLTRSGIVGTVLGRPGSQTTSTP